MKKPGISRVVTKKAGAPKGGAAKKSENSMTEGRGRRVEVTGEVVSNKMQKTISVQVTRLMRHKKYGKFISSSSVFKAHDEKNVAKVGDTVLLYHSRPLSKTKRWVLAEVLKTKISAPELTDAGVQS